MRFARPSIVLYFVVLATWACAPVWTVDYFITQDGPAHAYSASLMLRLLNGDPAAMQLVAFNPWTVSSSIGHWLLVALLTVVSPFIATKVMVTVTYAGVVAAVGFLRCATVGRDGMPTSLLIGAAIGFNWLWLGGLYNFLIGAIGLAVTVGLFYRWQNKLTPGRTVALSLLLLFVYVSHLVTFAVLVTALVLMAAMSEPLQRRSACAGVFVALVPVALLAMFYGSAAGDPSLGGERFFPVWRRLSDAGSIVSWLSHIRTADPFFLISRRALPFSAATSSAFAVFTPLLWLLAAAVALTLGTAGRIRNVPPAAWRRPLPLAVTFVACALAAAFGPDDFGTSHGTLLRERLALIAAVLFVPLYEPTVLGMALARLRTCVWLGSFCSKRQRCGITLDKPVATRPSFLALGAGLDGQESMASVIVLESDPRFPSNPTAEMSSFLGIESSTVVWDNYQIGYNLFPIVARNEADRRFVFDLTSTNVFNDAEPTAVRDARLNSLAAFFSTHHTRIGTILMWRRHPQVEEVLGRWYQADPFFEHGRGRLYRRRLEPGMR